jgi:photosystem II oxygen-evolving enhancer protein 1
MGGEFTVGNDGKVEFVKNDEGMDSNPVTTNIPKINPKGLQDRLERIPFLFSIKELKAQGTLDSFAGDFLVPSYRGATFMDPKVSWGVSMMQGYFKVKEGILHCWCACI